MFTLTLHNKPGIEGLDEMVEILPRAVDAALEKSHSGNINIAFVGKDEIAQKNASYRDKEGPTDILTFSYLEDIESAVSGDEVGDILVCLDVLREKHKQGFESDLDRVQMILTHGIVHMLGYDHTTDEEYEEMQKVEQKIGASI